ncbi:hypothetical protein ACFL6I_02655 [candidate division KSB1 bacterium]
MRRILFTALLTAVMISVHCSQAPPPQSAGEIIDRSITAHGGSALTDWNTMTVLGRLWMNDGNMFHAAYRVYAEKPGKLRVERDMTADRGRLFYEYFLNDGTVWQRNNLLPRSGNSALLQRWMNQCDGIAYYAENADELIWKEDTELIWKEPVDIQNQEYREVKTIQAYVLTAIVGTDTTDLCFDKENFYLVGESWGNTQRIYTDFKKFGGVTLASKFNEITQGRSGEVITPFSIEKVEYNTPIDEYLFTEDMPRTNRN